MAITYVIPTHKCNLTCKHCDLHLRKDDFNSTKFFEVYDQIDNEIILFGGEPLLNKSLLFELLKRNTNISSISSNMLLWDNAIQEELNKYPKIEIASSWNPFRFTSEQYQDWLQKITKSNKVTNINITLTDELYTYDKAALFSIFDDLNNIDTIKTISFEPLVPDYDVIGADKFLCDVYDYFRTHRIKIALNKIFGKKYCRGIKTLLPSGELINDCPQWYIANHTLLRECLDCKLIKICKPCKKLCSCSFPKNFYHKLQQLNELPYV